MFKYTTPCNNKFSVSDIRFDVRDTYDHSLTHNTYQVDTFSPYSDLQIFNRTRTLTLQMSTQCIALND